LPCKSINLVDATLRDSLKRVVTRSNGGNMKKSKGLSVYIAIKRIVMAMVMFSARRKSKSIEGNGIIITTRIVTTPMTVIISLTDVELAFDFTTCSIYISLKTI
jgi:hypothetical protein